MTICIGILASDGIVVAADREEGDGYVKTDQGKISTATRMVFPVGSITVAGAGWGSYLDEVAGRLTSNFCDIAESSEKAVVPELRKTHSAYYTEKILPFANYPSGERPDYSLLIACFGLGLKGVWSTSGLSFVGRRDYAAVGVGSKIARIWLDRLYDRVPTYYAAKLAAFVIHQVKQSAEGCGLGTDVLLMPREKVPDYVPDEIVREWEDIFRRYHKLERSVFYHSIGAQSEQQLLRTTLGRGEVLKKLREIRKALTRSDSRMSTGQQ